jgi:hypothetical protein
MLEMIQYILHFEFSRLLASMEPEVTDGTHIGFAGRRCDSGYG